VIEVDRPAERYRTRVAVDGVSFAVRPERRDV
jgi:hypothetical protein